VIGDVAATLDCAPDTVLAVTTTVAVCVIPTVLIVAETVFDSATAELRLPVATPLALVVVAGCVSVFPLPVAANATVAPWIRFPNPSLAVTVIVEVPVPAAIGDVALTVDWDAETAPAFTTTVAVCVTATELIVAETVFDSAAVELSVPVATPLALVVPTAASGYCPSWAWLPGDRGALNRVPVCILRRHGDGRRRAPAVIGEVAVTVDWAAETVPALTTTVAVCVMATELIVADTVFEPAAVELKLPVICPLASVVPTAGSTCSRRRCGRESDRGALNRVPVRILRRHGDGRRPSARAIGDVAVTIDCAADTVPAFTATVAVWVIATPLIVADTVFDSALVDDNVPVATPLALVVPTGCVSVLPVVGVAARVTVAP